MHADVFHFALKAVLYPLHPLYDRVDKQMRMAGMRAFQRIFKMCDLDKVCNTHMGVSPDAA